jgi:hypothetical protein
MLLYQLFDRLITAPPPPAVKESSIVEAAVDSVAAAVIPTVGAIALIFIIVFNPVTATVQFGFDAIAFTIEMIRQPIFTVRPRLCRQSVEPVIDTLASSIEPLVDSITPGVHAVVDPISSAIQPRIDSIAASVEMSVVMRHRWDRAAESQYT